VRKAAAQGPEEYAADADPVPAPRGDPAFHAPQTAAATG
jgi:hypothetical protein